MISLRLAQMQLEGWSVFLRFAGVATIRIVLRMISIS